MSEEWRPVPGYEGLYEVSDQGRVRRLCLRNRKLDAPRLMPTKAHWKGYRRVHLRLGATTVNHGVHRLVLLAFVGPCPAGHVAAHLNGIPDDNRLANVVWVTPKENEAHKRIHGTAPLGDRNISRRRPECLAWGDRNGSRKYPERLWRGERNHRAKLTAEQVRTIRGLASAGHTLEALGARYGISPGHLSDVVRRKKWAHVE